MPDERSGEISRGEKANSETETCLSSYNHGDPSLSLRMTKSAPPTHPRAFRLCKNKVRRECI